MKKSFTLIELLVVIGITLLLVFGVVTGLSAGRESREVKTTAERVRTMILEARSRAMNPEDTALGLQYVKLVFDTANQPNKVSIVEHYASPAIPDKIVQEYLLPKSIKIEPDISFLGGVTSRYCLVKAQNNVSEGRGQGIGVISFATDAPTHTMTISDISGTTKYDLKIFGLTGDVEIEAK